jgi:uncharacterized membrane protein (DUF2068 family)
MSRTTRPKAITAISLFFVFGALTSGLSAVMLLFPGSRLDPLWHLNPRAHEAFAAMGGWAVLLMAAVCVACATAATGLWRRQRWGLWTAIVILAINLVGDMVNATAAHDWRTLIGLPIAGLMIVYLFSKRALFARSIAP